MNPSCQFCQHYNKLDDNMGECRHKPPTVVCHKRAFSRHIHEITVFPKVKRNDWCSEHKNKE